MTLLTPDQVVERYPWLKPSGLRGLLFRRRENGLSTAVVRVGRRMLIDADRFEEWVNLGRES